MNKKLILLAVLVTKSLIAASPTIECRFAALMKNGMVGLDEAVPYTLAPQTGVTGFFEPYNFDISFSLNVLTVGVYLNALPLSAVQIPVAHIANVPLGGTIFGLSTVHHESVSGFISLQYECKMVLLDVADDIEQSR
jgi:hypothetical protein